jgi:hypothetical protein
MNLLITTRIIRWKSVDSWRYFGQKPYLCTRLLRPCKRGRMNCTSWRLRSTRLDIAKPTWPTSSDSGSISSKCDIRSTESSRSLGSSPSLDSWPLSKADSYLGLSRMPQIWSKTQMTTYPFKMRMRKSKEHRSLETYSRPSCSWPSWQTSAHSATRFLMPSSKT